MKFHNLYAWFYSLCVIEGIGALVFLFRLPSEGGKISPVRFTLLCILLAFTLLWAYWGWIHSVYLDRFVRPIYIILFAILSFTLCLILFILRYSSSEELFSIYERLLPFFGYFILVLAQLCFFLLYLRKGFSLSRFSQYRPVYVSAIVALSVLTAVFFIVILTRLGVTFDPAYWGEPGIPILGWQFALALSIGVFIFVLKFFLRPSLTDALLPISIYLIAVILWLSVPIAVLKDSYYMRISEPDYSPYPYADSAYYDQLSQSVLIGHPYYGVVPSRPIFIFFLTILHVLFGQDYQRILFGQTLVLALIPVLLYLLGKKIHGRTAGTIVASFFIFRELTSLWVSSETRVTNTKMILVDLPTLMLLLIACLLVLRWLEKKNPIDAFTAGGMFGVVLLLRTQSLLVVPFIILFALLVLGWKDRSFYAQTGIFMLGLALAIAPWLTHNYMLTGRITFDSAGQFNLLAGQYRPANDSALPTQDASIVSTFFNSLLANPGFVFGFIANHFLAVQVNGLLAFPIFEKFNGLFQPVNLYWMRWERGNVILQLNSILLLYVYIVVISIGLGSIWRRWRWLGLLPLAFSVGYATATAVSRYSGWRYDFPADWVWYFYFGMGFAELIAHISTIFGVLVDFSAPRFDNVATPRRATSGFLSLGILFVMVGSLPWAIKNIYPPRYADQSVESLSTKITSVTNAPTRNDIEAFMAQPDTVLEIGRLLYPRFFTTQKGLSSANPVSAYAIRDYPRMGFFLLNQTSQSVVFPMESIPGPVPHAEDVIVLGCQKDSYIEARLIVFPELDFFYARPSFAEPCSP